MSMFNYSIDIDNQREFCIFSINPDESVYQLQNDAEKAFGIGGIIYGDELANAFTPPALRIVKYEPVREDISNEDNAYPGAEFPLSNLMASPDLILRDVCVDGDGQLFAIFENKETGNWLFSHKFHGFLVVESRYNGFSSKSYKFQSSAYGGSCNAYVIEAENAFARCMMFTIPSDERKKASVLISEFRP